MRDGQLPFRTRHWSIVSRLGAATLITVAIHSSLWRSAEEEVVSPITSALSPKKSKAKPPGSNGRGKNGECVPQLGTRSEALTVKLSGAGLAA